jgi:hypothetical protein
MGAGLDFLGGGDDLPVIAFFFIGASTTGWAALTSFLLADALPYLGATAGLTVGLGWDGRGGSRFERVRTSGYWLGLPTRLLGGWYSRLLPQRTLAYLPWLLAAGCIVESGHLSRA